MKASIQKVLSANDTGETGGHQAGLLVPKDILILQFFPKLDPSTKNPRRVLDLRDAQGEEWTFSYIYYNNRLFGGTRNEYRVTCMTAFFRRYSLKQGDSVLFEEPTGRFYGIDYRRKSQYTARLADGTRVLRLTGNWTIVDTSKFT